MIMNLSQLVSIKKSLLEIEFLQSKEAMSLLAKEIDIGLLDIEQNFSDNSKLVRQAYASLDDNLHNVQTTLADLINAIDKEITKRAQPYCIRGTVFDDIPVVDKVNSEHEKSTRIRLFPPDIKFDIVKIIRQYTSNLYPALEIGPGNGQFTHYMVAGDPLYLVDINKEFLEKSINQFPPEYQRRVRTYQIDSEGFGDNDLSCLPQEQFSFVIAIDVMDYYTWDFVKDYLNNIYQVLRPGGHLMFTYNNCEDSAAVIQVEKGFKGWATETDVRSECTKIGYEIIETKNFPGYSHWAVVRKPGNLETIKLQQAMGEIVQAVG